MDIAITQDPILTLQEVAGWLKIKPRAVLRLGLPCLDFGHKTKRFLRSDVEAWLAGKHSTGLPRQAKVPCKVP